MTQRQESTASPPLRKNETAKRNGHNVEHVEQKDATKDKAAKKTSHKQIITNSGLILTTATKRKIKDSTAYNVETRMMEYEAANEDLQAKIDELQEISRKEEKTNLDLLRALQCQKSLKTLSSNCSPEAYIDAA